MAQIFMDELEKIGIVFTTTGANYFDTIALNCRASGFSSADFVVAEYHKFGINIRKIDHRTVSFSFDELTNLYDLRQLIEIMVSIKRRRISKENYLPVEAFYNLKYQPPADGLRRTSKFL